MIHSHSFAVIPKEYQIYDSLIQKHLVLDPGEEDAEPLYFYEETDDYWIVPRYFPEMMNKTYNLKYPIQYHEVEPVEISFKCNIEPRDKDQKLAINSLSKVDERFCILRARPGFGKTVCTIKALHNLGQRALIVVHREKLAKQWLERIVQFTDIKENEIPIFAGKLDKDSLHSMKIGIALIHTLASRYSRKETEYHRMMIEAGIGVVVVDECHVTVPTPQFHKGQGLLYANKYIGLSATPFRDTDEKTKIIYYHLGDKIYDIGHYDLKPIAYEVYFSSNIPEKTRRWITWGGKFILQRYLRKVVESPVYQALVLGLIKEAYDDGRHVLILAPRKETLTLLANLLKEKYGIEDIGFFWSGQSQDELNHKVVFATSQIFSEGLDVPRLDTLIVLDQFADRAKLEQMIGRILRKHDEKKRPKVVFLVDRDFQLQHFLSLKRRKTYNQIGFDFRIINL
jgi:superfamily II DNA or RNA helicase